MLLQFNLQARMWELLAFGFMFLGTYHLLCLILRPFSFYYNIGWFIVNPKLSLLICLSFQARPHEDPVFFMFIAALKTPVTEWQITLWLVPSSSGLLFCCHVSCNFLTCRFSPLQPQLLAAYTKNCQNGSFCIHSYYVIQEIRL